MRKLLFVLLLPAAAHADRRIELGIALGGHSFSTNSELGVADHMTEPGPESGGLLGLRFAFPFTKRIAAEAEAVAIPTQDDVLGDEATVYGVRAHARIDLLTGRVRPFIVAGTGMHVVRSDSPQMDNDTDRAYHWGGGLRYAISEKLEARLDGRHLLVPDRTRDGATSDYEVSAGITYRFGAQPRVVVVREPVVEERVVTKVVDLDKDDDGIVDRIDKCPAQPELRNGWQDDDGCPDQVIQELAGISFVQDSAKIEDSSVSILERAFVILKENPSLQVEISGHTSSEGHPERNLSLSLQRAEAVKAYLVKRGITDTRIHTIGHGSDVPIADNTTEEGRTLNRRIEFRILLPGEVP